MPNCSSLPRCASNTATVTGCNSIFIRISKIYLCGKRFGDARKTPGGLFFVRLGPAFPVADRKSVAGFPTNAVAPTAGAGFFTVRNDGFRTLSVDRYRKNGCFFGKFPDVFSTRLAEPDGVSGEILRFARYGFAVAIRIPGKNGSRFLRPFPTKCRIRRVACDGSSYKSELSWRR